ncbi:hepatic leukemia factor [Lingula anatina]|uniref:Hepatic leukemia factor n=1 Tax=Lingula anatina TaxID=7574 RepID=A0A1S3HN19_LINAN|nr:hepatic leukemia factor [Lingula anatina]|eukprot:XP_013387427.1 hepatic leukemia factor [Lingula anatina]
MAMGTTGVSLRSLLENPSFLSVCAPGAGDSEPKRSTPVDKAKALSSSPSYDAASAFLGPQIWDRTLPMDNDFKLEYMDLDEFLFENGIPLTHEDGVGEEEGDSQSSNASLTIAPESPPATSLPLIQKLRQVSQSQQGGEGGHCFCCLLKMLKAFLQQIALARGKRQHIKNAGDSEPKRSTPVDKAKALSSSPSYDAASAFLGPQIWDRTLPMDNDFKLEYMDLDEFLFENGIPLTHEDGVGEEEGDSQSSNASLTIAPESPPATSLPLIQMSASPSASPKRSMSSPEPGAAGGSIDIDKIIKVDYEVSKSDLALATIPGQDGFDPRRTAFSEEELKPQPMIKKSKKIFVPEDLKDERYWHRRRKNNVAAKRSRDARRIKENQIAMRASYLERENAEVKKQMEKVLAENVQLKKKLAVYEGKA